MQMCITHAAFFCRRGCSCAGPTKARSTASAHAPTAAAVPAAASGPCRRLPAGRAHRTGHACAGAACTACHCSSPLPPGAGHHASTVGCSSSAAAAADSAAASQPAACCGSRGRGYRACKGTARATSGHACIGGGEEGEGGRSGRPSCELVVRPPKKDATARAHGRSSSAGPVHCVLGTAEQHTGATAPSPRLLLPLQLSPPPAGWRCRCTLRARWAPPTPRCSPHPQAQTGGPQGPRPPPPRCPAGRRRRRARAGGAAAARRPRRTEAASRRRRQRRCRRSPWAPPRRSALSGGTRARGGRLCRAGGPLERRWHLGAGRLGRRSARPPHQRCSGSCQRPWRLPAEPQAG